MTATLKYATTSYKKMLLMAKLVNGEKVGSALTQLSHMPKTAAKILYKVVHSAAANATNNAWAQMENLFISKIDIGRGPKLKRMRFVARSRVHGYVKHRAFVRVILDTK